jgi:hypothetical protein
MNLKLSKLALFSGTALLLSATIVSGDSRVNESVMNATAKAIPGKIDKVGDIVEISELHSENLSTQVILMTEDQFEAVLFDNQSQETLAKLYWKAGDQGVSVVFNDKGKEQVVGLNVENIEDLTSEERYSVLLQGLREAGYAWQSKDTPLESQKKEISIESEFNIMAAGDNQIGIIDRIYPKDHYYDFLQPQSNITRRAAGWAYDPDSSSRSVWVHFYGRIPGQPYRYVGAVYANGSRPDVNRVKGITGNHGWTAVVPEEWDADGYRDMPGSCSSFVQMYYRVTECYTTFDAFAIDITGNGRRRLVKAPYTIKSSSVTYL